MLLIVAIVAVINVNGQSFYGGGATVKIHEVDYFDVKKNFEPVIYGSFFLGKKYEEGCVVNRVIETGINIGIPTSTILAESFSRVLHMKGNSNYL